jgi:hypothetical protein
MKEPIEHNVVNGTVKGATRERVARPAVAPLGPFLLPPLLVAATTGWHSILEREYQTRKPLGKAPVIEFEFSS